MPCESGFATDRPRNLGLFCLSLGLFSEAVVLAKEAMPKGLALILNCRV
jgi:hypothetical protein